MTIGPRRVDKPLVLYGYGKLGHLAEEIFNELKIPIAGFIDNRVPTKPFDALLAICVATEPYAQVTDPLIAAGWVDIAPIWEIIAAYPQVGIDNGWTVETDAMDRVAMFRVANDLDDEISWLNYTSFLMWRTQHTDPLIPPEPQESLPSTLTDIRARQHPYRILSGNCDSIEIHNEGHELQTLEWSIGELKKYRPRLTVACYHSRDGLWKIEKFLMDSLPDYRWTFRLHSYMGQSAYIYGTPKEKI
jgi:hypothetical protein